VRDRRRVPNRCDANSRLTDRPYRRFAAAAWSFDTNLDFPHPSIQGLSSSLTSSLLSGEWRAFARTAKTASTRRRLRHQIAVSIGDRDHRVVKRCCNVNDPERDILLLFLFVNLLFWCCHKSVGSRRWAVGSEMPPTASRQPLTISCRVPSSWQRPLSSDLCECARLYEYVDRERVSSDDDEGRDSNLCPSSV